MFSWATLLSILRQRKRIAEAISPEAVETYNVLDSLDYIEFPTLTYLPRMNSGHLNVELKFTTPKETPIRQLLPFPEMRVTEDIGIGFEYDIFFPQEANLLSDLSYLHQLRYRPYSPVFPPSSTVFRGEIGFPIDKSKLSPKITELVGRYTLQSLPEELKHRILVYEEEETLLEQVLKPDVAYLVREAELLDPSWNLDQLLSVLENRVPIESNRRLARLMLKKLTSVSSFVLGGANINVRNEQPIDIKRLIAPWGVMFERDIQPLFGPHQYMSHAHIYPEQTINGVNLFSYLNQLLAIASPGYSPPIQGAKEIGIKDEWATITKPLGSK